MTAIRGSSPALRAPVSSVLSGTLLAVMPTVPSAAHAQSVARVADINAGPGDSAPFNLTDVNGTLFFAVDDRIHGIELWKTDGTRAGTLKTSRRNSSERGKRQ